MVLFRHDHLKVEDIPIRITHVEGAMPYGQNTHAASRS